MRWLSCSDTTIQSVPGMPWDDLCLPAPWSAVIPILTSARQSRPVQEMALTGGRVLQSEHNVVLSAPTNSGKSLVATLLLLDAVRNGRRAVLLSPLRALAREQYTYLHALARPLGKTIARPFRVRLTTGDIRADDERLMDGPPSYGELLIATPERLEALLRQPAHDPWLDTIGMVAVDEAHLLDNVRRGPTMEHLITTFLTRPTPPRIALLSATLRDTDRLCDWLNPCDVIRTEQRWPPLTQRICALDEGEDKTEALQTIARETLLDPDARLLVFVYQTRTAEKLARLLPEARAYHAQLTTAVQNDIRAAFEDGRCRCVITTTALALGVNLPATHVVVYDTTFPGVGPLTGSDILQMTGRSGRGDRAGNAIVLARLGDDWTPEALTRLLDTGVASEPEKRADTKTTDSIATQVAAYLARQAEPVTASQVQHFFARSLRGAALSSQVPIGLNWLADPWRVLAFGDEEGRYRLTVLGEAATRAVLPLPLASGFAQLLRDLFTIDADDSFLVSWQPLDFLVLLHLLHANLPTVRPHSADLIQRVDGWMEAHPGQVPMLYREWLGGDVQNSRSREVLGSLAVPTNSSGAAHRVAYRALFHAIMIWERGQGRSMEDLMRAYKVADFSGVEDRWRDECLWLLSGLVKLLEIRCFYYHLKESCQAESERIQRIKRQFQRWRRLIWQIEGALIYCSPLGGVLQEMRRLSGKNRRRTIGVMTIRRLEAAGIRDVAGITQLTYEQIRNLGVQESYITQLQNYIRRRAM